MASKNQVTLTFAGDSEKLEKAFDDVGKSAKGMADDVDKSAKEMESSFDRAGDGLDGTGEKAGDLESGLRGTTDVMSGFADIAAGNTLQGLTDMAGGVEALATGFTGVLVPALKKSWAWLAQTKVGMLAHAAATKVVGAATKVWTGIQAAFNFVMALNPIVLVVIAVIALIAVIIIAYKKSETFRAIVDGAFRWVLKTVKLVWNWIKDNWKLLLGIITGPIGLAVFLVAKHWGKIRAGASAVWGFIRRGFNRVTSWITAPFRAGARAASSMINGVRNAWNRYVGGRGFTVPDWVPVVGGKSFHIPKFHTGGVVPGLPGQQTLALLQGGERITAGGGRGGGATTVIVQGGGGTSAERALATLVLQLIRTGALTLNVREGKVVAAHG